MCNISFSMHCLFLNNPSTLPARHHTLVTMIPDEGGRIPSSCVLLHVLHFSSQECMANGGAKPVSTKVRVLRAFKVMRLVKIIRILKASEIVE